MLMPSRQKGLSYIPVIIVLALLIALFASLFPSYQNYQRKSHFITVLKSIDDYVVAVNNCYQEQGTLTGCNAGTNHIPEAITEPTGVIDELSVTNGIIALTPGEINGVTRADSLTLTPHIENNHVMWKKSGPAVDRGYVGE